MTDEIPQAAYAFVDKLALTETDGTFSHRTAAARLAHENGLVPKAPEPDRLTAAARECWEVGGHHTRATQAARADGIDKIRAIIAAEVAAAEPSDDALVRLVE